MNILDVKLDIKYLDFEDFFLDMVSIAILIIAFAGIAITAILAAVNGFYAVSEVEFPVKLVKLLYVPGIPAGVVTLLVIIVSIWALKVHFKPPKNYRH